MNHGGPRSLLARLGFAMTLSNDRGHGAMDEREKQMAPAQNESKKRLLQYALERLGRKELAARLRVPEKMVEDWLAGSADMTHNRALVLADLVQDLTHAK
jgi:hypothetical protein